MSLQSAWQAPILDADIVTQTIAGLPCDIAIGLEGRMQADKETRLVLMGLLVVAAIVGGLLAYVAIFAGTPTN